MLLLFITLYYHAVSVSGQQKSFIYIYAFLCMNHNYFRTQNFLALFVCKHSISLTSSGVFDIIFRREILVN